MKDYVLVFKVKELTTSQANRLQAESSIRAKQIAPGRRNVVAIETKGDKRDADQNHEKR